MCVDLNVNRAKLSESEHTKSLIVGGVRFDGPFFWSTDCRAEPGIIAILELNEAGEQRIVNAYQTANMRTSAALELSYCIEQRTAGAVATFYTKVLNAQMSSQLASFICHAAK